MVDFHEAQRLTPLVQKLLTQAGYPEGKLDLKH